METTPPKLVHLRNIGTNGHKFGLVSSRFSAVDALGKPFSKKYLELRWTIKQ